ncbi:hypothetical protein BDQ12DRAFT_734142 [Crucibulum laeve]|uniref:Uncharacterized protein n=1 Tax=Crucibulum laeve TaxID=68775 RepID=A0A5C3M623_9AGAR|nr:hypothetical protein BDQ12DRAFT_734142 [Crucibulum laeve]
MGQTSSSAAFTNGRNQKFDGNLILSVGGSLVHIALDSYASITKGENVLLDLTKSSTVTTLTDGTGVDDYNDRTPAQPLPSTDSFSDSSDQVVAAASNDQILSGTNSDTRTAIDASKRTKNVESYVKSTQDVDPLSVQGLHASEERLQSLSPESSRRVSIVSCQEAGFSSPSCLSRCNSCCHIYVDKMLPLKHGYPLWLPDPDLNLPFEYRRLGIRIGDLGIITADGGFDFLFNIWLSSSHPINPPNLPENFNSSTSPEPKTCRQDHVFNRCSNISSADVQSDVNWKTCEMAFTCTDKNAGALLSLPDGASREDLKNEGHLAEYISANAEWWYEYAKNIAGRSIDRNSLYLVTGYMKSKSWGIATYNPCPSERTNVFEFGKSPFPDGPRYIWKQSNGGTARSGPCPDTEMEDSSVPLLNQCLFLRGFKIALSEEAWRDLSEGTAASNKTSHNSNNNGHHADKGSRSSSSNPSQSPSTSASHQFQGQFQNRVNLDMFPSKTHLFHPSDITNDILLREASRVAIAHDNEWCSVLDESGMPDKEMFNGRIRTRYRPIYVHGVARFIQIEDSDVAQGVISTHYTVDGIIHLCVGIQTHDKSCLTRPSHARSSYINADKYVTSLTLPVSSATEPLVEIKSGSIVSISPLSHHEE